MYQELSEVKFNAVLKSSLLFPCGIDRLPCDAKEEKAEYPKRYKEAVSALTDFQNLLFKYAPFIEENLYKDFDEIRILIQHNVNCFFDAKISDDKPMPEKTKTDCYLRTETIIDKQHNLIKKLRNHLKSLKVQED